MDLKVDRVLPAPAYRVYRRWRVQRMVGNYVPRVAEHVYGGLRLRVALEDPLGEGWYDHDWPLLPEIAFLAARSLKPGARVFDLGAHQGVVALMLADAVGEDGRVVAVEAVPHNAQVAQRNCDLNSVSNVHVVNAAVGTTSGVAFVPTELNAHVTHNGGAGLVEVRAVTIDELSGQYGTPDVILIDVEGSELAALHGALQTLRDGRCAWLVEVHVGNGLEDAGGSASQVLDELRRTGGLLYGAPGTGSDSHFKRLEHADSLFKERFFVASVPALEPTPRTK